MKKIIAFLGTSLFVITPLTTLIACQKNLQNINKYFNNADINKIDPIIRNEVKYTSPIAQILIASRHENANYYAFPAINYFLSYIEDQNEGIFTTSDGQKINIKDYVEGYKYFNKDFYDFYNYKQNNALNADNNAYKNMNYVVLMDKLGPLLNGNFETNPDTAWAMYDTGAYASTIAHFSDSVTSYAYGNFNHSGYFGGDSSKGIASSMLYDNNLSVLGVNTKDKMLAYTDNNNSPTKGKINEFGKQVFQMADATTNLNSLIDLNHAFTALQYFSEQKFYVLEYLSKLIPFVNTNVSDNPTFSHLMSFPLIMGSLVIKQMYNMGKNNPLLQYFSDSVVNPTSKDDPGYVHENGENKVLNLTEILNEAFPKALLAAATDLTTHLDTTWYQQNNQQLSDCILYYYFLLGKWFDQATKHPRNKTVDLINNPDARVNFNKIIDDIVQNTVANFKTIIKVVPMTDEAGTLINSLFGMINENFDSYDLVQALSGFANWFFTYNDESQTLSANIKHANAINQVQSYQFNGDISDSSSNESLKYQNLIDEKYGIYYGKDTDLDENNSLFYMMNGWATGQAKNLNVPASTNEKYIAASRFIDSMLNPQTGFVGKMILNSHQEMQQNWFNTVFSSQNWRIKASGTDPEGNLLGAKYSKDHSKLTGVRYELDYYGPKDRSTDVLGHHQTQAIDYYNPLGHYPHEETAGYPDSSKNWQNNSEADWQQYDGNGNEYSDYSNKIVYKYVVDFDNIATNNNQLTPEMRDNWLSFMMTDFKWYYDINESDKPQRFY